MSKANNIASLLNSSGLLDSDDIATNAITNSKIASGAIDSDAIGTDAITAAKLNIGQVGGRRNLIINGAMEVWQRGTTGFGHNVYSADRWVESTNSSDSLAISLFEIPSGGETGLPTMFTHAMKCAVTASTGGGLNDLRQRIEYPKRFMGQTVTLSYYIKASSACSIVLRRLDFTLVTNAPDISYLPNLNVTTSWQRVVDTVTLNSSSSAVFSSNSYLDVVLSLPVNQTADVYITGVQLELGDTATPFEHRSYGEELALCQRYYEIVGMTMTTSGEFDNAVSYAVTKRATPGLSVFSGSLGTATVLAMPNNPLGQIRQQTNASSPSDVAIEAKAEL